MSDPLAEAPETASGWTAPEVADEFPELRLRHATVEAELRASSRELRGRLRHLSDRFRGAQAVALRRDPVPHAYRVFFRHVGLDPDATRTPVEAAALERLMRGGFASRNTVEDALTIALVETGVPVWALDADRVTGRPGIRLAEDGERVGEGQPLLRAPGGRLVVADAERALAILFGEPGPGVGVGRRTRRILLFAVQVAGVPEIHVEEAIWSVRETLLAG